MRVDKRLRIVAAALVTLLVAALMLALRQGLDEPVRVRLVLVGDASRSITIVWETRSPDSGDLVLYDAASRSGELGAYRYRAQGRHYPRPGAPGYIHVVRLEGLSPNTTYYFVCGGDGGWSRELAFKTAPSARSHVRFVVGGDCRTNRAARDAVSQAMARFNPDFVVLTGDLVEDGGSPAQWEDFFEHVSKYWVRGDGLLIPVVPCIGNHDKDRLGWEHFLKLFGLPTGGGWFYVNWGEVHIVILNSEASSSLLKLQRSWLEEDLVAHADYRWKIVVFHRNVLPSRHAAFKPAFELGWIKVISEHGVDLVFNGHTHLYLRSKPLRWSGSNFTAGDERVKGTIYVITGGWGAPLYEHPYPHAWWVASYEKVHHFVLVDVYPNGTLHLQAKDFNGVTFDEAWITKPLTLPMRQQPSLTTSLFLRALIKPLPTRKSPSAYG